MPQDPTLDGFPGLSRCGNTGIALGRREDEVEKVLFIIQVVGEHTIPGVLMGLEGWGQRGPRLAWSPIPVPQPVLTQVAQGALVHLEPRGGQST